mgnify:CR=1 FL=1
MRVARDTNILAYAEGVGDAERCRQATELVASLSTDATILPAQTLGELFLIHQSIAAASLFFRRQVSLR